MRSQFYKCMCPNKYTHILVVREWKPTVTNKKKITGQILKTINQKESHRSSYFQENDYLRRKNSDNN